MCITAPARVIAVDAAGATVELAGSRRRAATLTMPDVVPGDWVLVGAGTVLRRLDPAEALEIRQTIEAAIAASSAAAPNPGGPR
jgi:hydrogenase assembly chaperone HypC/HupF